MSGLIIVSVRKVYIVEEKLLKSMTLIIGIKCKNGVVLASDRKVMEGGEARVEDKIMISPQQILYAGAGLKDLFDKFLFKIHTELTERTNKLVTQYQKKHPEEEIKSDAITPYKYAEDFINDCEKILADLANNYEDVILKAGQGAAVLIAFRSGANAELHYIDTENAMGSRRNNYLAIGSSAQIANIFLKELWTKDITMKEGGKLASFIIEYIDKSGLDNFVGEGYQIQFIPDLDIFVLNIIQKEQKGEKLTDEELKSVEQYKIQSFSINRDEIISIVNLYKSSFKKVWENIKD